MASKIIKIGKIKFTFVFRDEWDNKNELKYNSEFRYYRIGLWFRKNRIVGSKNFNKPKEWSKNLINEYMLGVDLIICKVWITF